MYSSTLPSTSTLDGGEGCSAQLSGKDPVPIVQGTGWVPGPVWTGAENPAPTWIRSPDRPVLSESKNPEHYAALNGLTHRTITLWHGENK